MILTCLPVCLCLFRVAGGGRWAEGWGGEDSQVPTVQEDGRSAFAAYVPAIPQSDYAWRFFGKVAIYSAGPYAFCTNSDDGSLFYMAVAPSAGGFAPSSSGGYALLIDNDGLHGPTQVRPCSSLDGIDTASAKLIAFVVFCTNAKSRQEILMAVRGAHGFAFVIFGTLHSWSFGLCIRGL